MMSPRPVPQILPSRGIWSPSQSHPSWRPKGAARQHPKIEHLNLWLRMTELDRQRMKPIHFSDQHRLEPYSTGKLLSVVGSGLTLEGEEKYARLYSKKFIEKKDRNTLDQILEEWWGMSAEERPRLGFFVVKHQLDYDVAQRFMKKNGLNQRGQRRLNKPGPARDIPNANTALSPKIREKEMGMLYDMWRETNPNADVAHAPKFYDGGGSLSPAAEEPLPTTSRKAQDQAGDVISPPLPPNKRYLKNALSDDNPPLLNREPVSLWENVMVDDNPSEGHPRFDGQIILQLENDPTVREAAENLAGKHPDRSVLVQLDDKGDYRVVHGDPSSLFGQLRWQVVGHGRRVSNAGGLIQTLGGLNPGDFSTQIAQLSQKLNSDYAIKSTPRYISLVGCSLAELDSRVSYGHELATWLDREEHIRADIAVRRVDVSVDPQGRKWTLGSDDHWHHKISGDKLVLQWDQQGTLELLLAPRLERAMAVLDSLALREINYTDLSLEQRSALADFFKLPHRGGVDEQHLMLTVLDERRYWAWRHQAQQLLQRPDTHPQLRGLTGQESLQQSQQWTERQAESIAALIQSSRAQNISGVTVDYTFAPQALYMERPRSTSQATALGLAWLDTRAHGPNESDRFLNGILTHAHIRERQAIGMHSEREKTQADEFYRLLNAFSSLELTSSLPPLKISTFQGVLGDYLIKVGDHHMMLSSRSEKGGALYSLYDPSVGEIRVTGPNAVKNGQAFTAILSNYVKGLLPLQKGPFPPNSALPFVLYPINIVEARANHPELGRLYPFLNDFYTEQQRLELEQPEVTVGRMKVSALTLSQMGATVGDTPLSYPHIEADLETRLRFNPVQLSHYLSQVANKDDPACHEVMKLLKTLTADRESKPLLLTAHATGESQAFATELLGKIYQHVEEGEINPALWSSLRRGSTDSLARLNRFSHPGSLGMQGYGYTRQIRDLIHYHRRLNRQDLTASEKQDLEFERNWVLASLGVNFFTDSAQYGLHQWGRHLGRTGMTPTIQRAQNGLKTLTPFLAGRMGSTQAAMRLDMFGARLGQLGFNGGLKLARFGGPALNVLQAGFDIYHAYRLFSQLPKISDLERRQDLRVQGTLSGVAAAVGIGTGIAFALGGTAAAAAGPLGLGLGAGIWVGSEIYAAVREVELLKKHLTLTPAENAKIGWQRFLEGELTVEHQWILAEKEQRPAIRTLYNQLLEKKVDHAIETWSPLWVERYYYSRRHFDLSVTGVNELDLSMTGLCKNLILPYVLYNKGLTYRENLRFIATDLYGVNDIVDANQPLSLSSSVGVREPVLTSRPPAKKTVVPSLAGSEDTVMIFDLDDGNDIAVGHVNKKNLFYIDSGTKRYTGGRLSDRFYLRDMTRGGDSILKGGQGSEKEDLNDWVVPLIKPGHHLHRMGNGVMVTVTPVGYTLDLDSQEGHVDYRQYDKNEDGSDNRDNFVEHRIATLIDIDHASGHAETDDKLVGNEGNNILDGQGGNDILLGKGGDDVLSLAAGEADGGSGKDTYRILQSLKSDRSTAYVSVTDTDSVDKTTEEVSNLMLDYDLAQINSITLNREGQVLIRLTNDSSQTTLLTLNRVYQASEVHGHAFRLKKKYVLSTRDGFLFTGQWPEVMVALTDDVSFHVFPAFQAQYSILHDLRDNSKTGFNSTGKKPVIELQMAMNQQSVTVNGTPTFLPKTPHFSVELIAEDTPFNDRLLGNDENNTLHSRRGNDEMKGKGGADHYFIHHDDNAEETSRIIWIDNEDLQPDPELDRLILPVAIEQLNKINREGDHIVLSPATPTSSQLTVGLRHFMVDARYRHMTVVDKQGDSYPLGVDEQGQPYLGQKQSDIQATKSDDTLVLSKALTLADMRLHALSGNDMVIDRSQGKVTLYGDEGNDILIATERGKTLDGGEGNDKLFGSHSILSGGAGEDILLGGDGEDLLQGGTGNDDLRGGQGDDVYRFALGDGHDTLIEEGGHDILDLTDSKEITREKIWLQKEGPDLKIEFGGPFSGDSVTIRDYYDPDMARDPKVDTLQVAGYQLTGDHIERLRQAMAAFPLTEGASSSLGPETHRKWAQFWTVIPEVSSR
ncbi:C80 family cysteine peptidase [Candidatus Williamhamiltonella defendens]|uniref:C80 family cysteine peptidase n=1 Tax=Candidatus Williamhamiltonella defendens TaxID=138072 RepID=UPI001C2ECE9D|nr:C80 family cysteine peptidase [Candidatus Hamiltonella defensa]